MSSLLRRRRTLPIVVGAAALLVSTCARPRPSTVPGAPRSRGLSESSLVAYRFAPVFLQARSKRSGDGKEFEDYFVRYDYDGNASGFNNWENLSASGARLEAVVYAAVRQTAKNYYLHYVYFHPRDPKLIGKHENDLEGAMVVVKKGRAGGPDARDISIVQVQAHNRWDYARLDTLCRLGTGEGLDQAVCSAAAGTESRTHPVLTSQVGHNFWFNQGHGTEIPGKDDLPRNRTTYVPWTKANTIPASSADAGVPDDTGAPVTYVLVSLSGDVDGDGTLDREGPFGDPPAAGLWDRRRDVRIFGKDEKSPGHGLQGDDGCKANTPWGWTGFGDARPGIFFLEPTSEPAWSELRSRGVIEDKGVVLARDPYGNDTDLNLYPPTPGPLGCDCTVMHAAFVNPSASRDPLEEGAACVSEAAPRAATATIARTQWDTCRELREWVPEDAGERAGDQGEESAASCYLQLSGDVLLRWPPEGDADALRGTAPSLRVAGGPITHVEVRARTRTGRLSLGGFFLQAGIEYDESLGRAPKLLPVTVGPEWTPVRFALNASPDFNPDAPPSVFVLSADPSSSLQPTRSGRVPPGPSWEVDRITLLSEGSPRAGLPPPPIIESVTPARVAYGDTVTVTGSGFSTACAFNDVRLGDQPQLVLTCSADRLTFQARGTGSMLLSIRTASGVASVPRTRPPVVNVAPAR
jgi:hypothetical protein